MLLMLSVQNKEELHINSNNLHPDFVKIGGKTRYSQVIRIKEEERRRFINKSKSKIV